MSWRRDPKVWGSIVVTLLLWASAFAGIRAGMRIDTSGVVGLGGIGPGELALLRFGTASIVFIIYAIGTGMKLPDRADMPYLALTGFIGITCYHVALNFGEMQVSSAAAAVIIASSPIFAALLARFYLDERISARKAAGIGLAFAGVVAISFGEGGNLSFQPSALLILFAAMSYALFSVMGKRPLRKYSSLQYSATSIWFGTLPLLVFAPSLMRQMSVAEPSSIAAGVYLGVFPGAIAYLLWNYALKRMPVTSLVVFLNAQPIGAAIIAWFWRGEVPMGLTIAGGLIALVGVALVQIPQRGRGITQEEA